MTHHDSAHEETEDRFYAQFDSREVELMTLDELQAAFEAGQIHENTFVCREGESEWLTLADVAGLGEEAPEPAPVVESRPPMPSRRPDMPAALESRPPMPERRPAMNTMPAARLQAEALRSVPPSAAVVSSTPLSFAPVTSNINYDDLDLDEDALRPKRRWGLLLAAAAVLALAGGGTVFAINGGGRALASAMPSKSALSAAASNSQASLTLSNIQTKPSEPVAPTPVAPPASEPTPAAAPVETAKSAPAFSDDMKQALLAADKSRTTKHAAKVKAHVAAAAPRRGKAASASTGFKSGGSAYDPLNGKL